MASNTVVHSKMGIVDATGKICQFCPKASGMDVRVNGKNNSGNTIQELNDNLAKIAFDKSFMGINDDATSGTNITYSTKKLNSIKSDVTNDSSLNTAYEAGASQIATKIRELGVACADTKADTIATGVKNVAIKGYDDGRQSIDNRLQTCDAERPHIFAGKTFTSKYGINLVGTMPVNDVFDTYLKPNESMSKSGYIRSGSKVSAYPVNKILIDTELHAYQGSSSVVNVSRVIESGDIHVILGATITNISCVLINNTDAQKNTDYNSSCRVKINNTSLNGDTVNIEIIYNSGDLPTGSNILLNMELIYV